VCERYTIIYVSAAVYRGLGRVLGLLLGKC
jgi:hypothetical protein